MAQMNTLDKILLLQSALYSKSRDKNGVEDKLTVTELLKTVQKWALFNKSTHLDEADAKQYIEEENLLDASADNLKEKIEHILPDFKNIWIGEIRKLELEWVDLKNEIKDIETGKMNDKNLITEYYKANGEPVLEENPPESQNTSHGADDTEKEPEAVVSSAVERAEDLSSKNIHKRTRSKSKLDSDTEGLGEIREEELLDASDNEHEVKKPKIQEDTFTIAKEKLSEHEEAIETIHRKEDEEKKDADISHEVISQVEGDTKKNSEKEVDLNTEKKGSIGVENGEAESTSEQSPAAGEKPMPSSKTMQHLFIQILSQLESHRFSSMFLNPVSGSDEPEYFNLILQPIDLKTIHRKVRAGEIDSLEKLERDINLMLANAVMYNDMNEERVSTAIKEVETQWIDLRNILKESIYG